MNLVLVIRGEFKVRHEEEISGIEATGVINHLRLQLSEIQEIFFITTIMPSESILE